MKKLRFNTKFFFPLLVISFFLTNSVYSQIEDSTVIYDEVDKYPEFPGGASEMYRFIANNIKYPKQAQRANVTGKVLVKFVVDDFGQILNPVILEGIGFGCDEEVIRVLKLMPRWTPGYFKGKKVYTWFTMPVVYSLGRTKKKRKPN